MSPTESVGRRIDAIAASLDRRRHLILTVVATLWFLLLVLAVRGRPFWHDEVYTVLVARLPLGTMWSAYLDAIDLSPPLNTIITRGLHLVAGEGPIVSRLPPMTGYLVMSVVLFAFVRRRTNAMMAFAAALLPMGTIAWAYAQEARGYGLTMACFACALYGWAEAAAGRRPVAHLALMSTALAAGVWTHYYFAIAVLPIVCGEIVRQALARRVDWRPWLALVASGFAILPLLPLAAVASEQRTTFWARPRTMEFSAAYGFIVDRLGRPGYTLTAVYAILVVAAVALVAARFERQGAARRLAAHDLVACLCCLALPAVGVALGFVTGAFAERYVVFAIVGLVAAVPVLAWAVFPRSGWADLACLIGAVAIAFIAARQTVRDEQAWHDYLTDRPILTDWFKGGADIVVTGALDYIAIWYYTPAEAQPRVKYLADPEGQMAVMGTDTVDRGYLALSRWLPIPVERIGPFTRRHQHFFLYAPGKGDSWTERRIRSWHARITYFGRDEGGRLYEIQLPPR